MNRFFGSMILLILAVQFLALPVYGQVQLRDERIDMVIVLDRSGSMNDNDPESISVAAASFLVEQLALLGDRNRVAIVPFSNRAHILGQHTPNPARALQAPTGSLIEMMAAGVSEGPSFPFRETASDNPAALLSVLRGQMRIAGGDTDLLSALRLARGILRNSPREAKKYLFLICDGRPELDRWDGPRKDEFAKIFGAGLALNHEGRNRQYRDYIRDTEAPAIGREGIELMPVAFQGKSAKAARKAGELEAYLRELKRKSNGDGEIVLAGADDLVAKLANLMPASSNHIVVHEAKNFITAGASQGAVEVSVPEVAVKTRFFIAYTGATSAHRTRIVVTRNGGVIADSGAATAAATFHSLYKKNGGLIFQSIIINDPNLAAGNFRIEVRAADGSPGVPAAALISDIRSRFYALLDFQQQPVCAPGKLDLRVTLFDEKRAEKPVVYPIRSAAITMRRAGTDQPISLSNVQAEQAGSLVAGSEEGLPEAGRYRMEAALCIENCDDPQRRRAVRFRYDMAVQACSTPQLWIKRRNMPVDPNPRIDLAPLGETFGVTNTLYEIRTDFNGVLPGGLRVVMPPLRHTERPDKELIAGGVNWARVTPVELRGNIFEKGMPLTVEVQVPNADLPLGLPDGNYTSTVEIRQGEQPVYSVPVNVNIRIPRFVGDRKEVNNPFDPDAQNPPVVVEKIIRYPGTSRHDVKIKLWSTTVEGAGATVRFGGEGEQYGLRLLKDRDEPQEREPKVVFGAATREYKVAGKNEEDAGVVSTQVQLLDDSLNGQAFTNTAYVMGKKHRPLPVRINVRVAFVPLTYMYGLYAGAGIFGAVLIFLWWRIFRDRGLFEGREGRFPFIEGRARSYSLAQGGREIASFRYDGESLPDDGDLASSGSNQSFRLNASGSYRREGQSERIDGGYTPAAGDEVTIGYGANAVTLLVTNVPTATAPRFSYRVRRSPLRTGRLQYLFLTPGAALLLFTICGAIVPYGILRILGL